MKLKRRATGVYDVGPVTIQKWCHEWWLIAHGVKMVSVRTLGDARQLLPHVRPYLYAAAETARERESKERCKRAAQVIYQCRLRDSVRPPSGIPWATWAESRVGTTAADVRAACEADAVDEALGELETRFTSRQIELIGDWLKDNGFAA